MGNVLVNFHPQNFLEKRVAIEKRDKIRECIFQSQEWQKLDRGTITEEEALRAFIQKLPEEKSLLEEIFPKYLTDCLSPNEENIHSLYLLKQKGYQLYILSNFHKRLFEKIEKEWEMFSLFDGGVVSCYCHLLKPEREIYKTLLEKYSLQAQESIFIDDVFENVEAAKSFGMKGIHLPKQKELQEKIAFLWE